MEIISIADLYS